MSTPTGTQETVRNWLALVSVGLGVVAMFLAVIAKTSAVALLVAVLVSGGGIATGWLGFRAARQLMKQKGRNWAIAGIIVGVIGLVVSIALLAAPA